MLVDGAEERGGAEVDLRWGDPHSCHFPLLPLPTLTLPYMAAIYGIMWFGIIKYNNAINKICKQNLFLLGNSFNYKNKLLTSICHRILKLNIFFVFNSGNCLLAGYAIKLLFST